MQKGDAAEALIDNTGVKSSGEKQIDRVINIMFSQEFARRLSPYVRFANPENSKRDRGVELRR